MVEGWKKNLKASKPSASRKKEEKKKGNSLNMIYAGVVSNVEAF